MVLGVNQVKRGNRSTSGGAFRTQLSQWDAQTTTLTRMIKTISIGYLRRKSSRLVSFSTSINLTSGTKAYNDILVVVKQTPYQSYIQMKAQGRAPVALRWERLKNRDEVHSQCVSDVTTILAQLGIRFQVIRRDELHRGLLQGKDLVIAVGGDGTILNTSSFIDDSIPLLGVNSDPTRPDEHGVRKIKDERRSRGALCATTATTVNNLLPRILHGEFSPGLRSRIQCLIRSTYTETRLPPALNDILIVHPIPAAVSRFRLALCKGTVSSSYAVDQQLEDLFSLNVWSSGLWVSTATGSTAAMASAGGVVMDIRSSEYVFSYFSLHNYNIDSLAFNIKFESILWRESPRMK